MHRITQLRRLALVMALGAALMMVVRDAVAHRSAPPSLPRYGRLPDVALTDHQERPMTLSTLKGSVWIADFMLTRCAGQCPLMSAQMAMLQRELQDVREVQLISFSVDPSYDTPQRLAAYAAHWGADASRWRFVTGDPDAMTRLIQTGFHLAVGPGESAREPMTHSTRLVLVDRQGAMRGYYEVGDAPALRKLREDARRLARER